jgi:hypothetical protein
LIFSSCSFSFNLDFLGLAAGSMIPTCPLFTVVLVRASKSATVLFLPKSVLQRSCPKALRFSLSGFYRPLIPVLGLLPWCSQLPVQSESHLSVLRAATWFARVCPCTCKTCCVSGLPSHSESQAVGLVSAPLALLLDFCFAWWF